MKPVVLDLVGNGGQTTSKRVNVGDVEHVQQIFGDNLLILWDLDGTLGHSELGILVFGREKGTKRHIQTYPISTFRTHLTNHRPGTVDGCTDGGGDKQISIFQMNRIRVQTYLADPGVLRAFLVFRQDGIGDVAKHTILAEFKGVVGTVNSTVNAPPPLVQLGTHVGTNIGLHNVFAQFIR